MLKIAARSEYACRAMIELALSWPTRKPLGLQAISGNQRIPPKFLPHIMVQLKQFGFIESLRGKRGGYVLATSPDSITLANLIRYFEPRLMSPGLPSKKKLDALVMALNGAEKILWDYLESQTMADLARAHKTLAEASTYDI